MTYKPKGAFKRDLAQAGLTYAQFLRASAFFLERHVDFNYVQGKGFRFEKWVGDLPQMIILWTGNGTTRDCLAAPETLFAELDRIEKQEVGYHFAPTPDNAVRA